jgi:hypothetical protein
MTVRVEKKAWLQVEQLEDRVTPGLLTVTPRVVSEGGVATLVADAAMHGLTNAQAHTAGVIIWMPGGTTP